MRALLLPTIALLLLPALSSPAAAEWEEEEYNMPSSFVIRGIFGFGILLCTEDSVPDLVKDTAKNGPCFDYTGREDHVYSIGADDDIWADTSVTVAVDINGDGCVSDSCQGVPNDADYRISNCGSISDRLPETDGGDPVLQVFLRVLDVSQDLHVCGASNGVVIFETASG